MELLSSFFQIKINARILVSSSILLIVTYFIFFNKPDLLLFPSEKPLTVDLYTDQNDQGNSLLLDSIRNDSCIGMRFLLKEGFVNPYAGFNLAKYKDSLVDVADYNRLELELHAVNVSDLHIYLITKDKHVKDTTNRLAYRHNYFNVDMVAGKNLLNLEISKFVTPDWWYTVVGQPKNDFGEIEWKKLNRVAFATGINPKLDAPCSIMLYRLRFYRNNFVVIGYLIVIQFGIMGVLFLFHYRKAKKLATKVRQTIQIHYKAVGVEEKPKSGYAFLDYIHLHFADSELSLAQIAKETGVPQRNISDTISEKFDCNFKTYVNQIRINEAKRLLKETDLNSSEIAYAVGFSSPGSFNRVFKNLTGKTPSESSGD